MADENDSWRMRLRHEELRGFGAVANMRSIVNRPHPASRFFSKVLPPCPQAKRRVAILAQDDRGYADRSQLLNDAVPASCASDCKRLFVGPLTSLPQQGEGCDATSGIERERCDSDTSALSADQRFRTTPAK
jgi:hypothetical protein